MWKLWRPFAYTRADPLKFVIHGPPLLRCSMLSFVNPMVPDTELDATEPSASSIAFPLNGGFGVAGYPTPSHVLPAFEAFQRSPSQPSRLPGALSIQMNP